MKTIILAALFLLANPAHAITTNFFIFFDETMTGKFEHADWQGMFTITDGQLTAFSALIGACANPLDCTWDRFQDAQHTDPGAPGSAGGIIITHTGNDRLTYIPSLGNLWVTVTDRDPAFLRTGVYAVAATPEPSALWLLLAGSLSLLWMKPKR